MAEAPHHHKRRSWFHPSRPSSSSGRPSSSSGGRSRPGSSSGGSGSWSISLPTPTEGQQLDLSRPATPATEHAPPHHGVPFTRSETYDSPPVSRPTTPRRLSAIVLTSSSSKQGGDDNNNKEDGFQPLVRAQSAQPQLSSVRSHESSTGKGSFGKMSLTSMLSTLSLSRTTSSLSLKDEDSRGRSMYKSKGRSASQTPAPESEPSSRSVSRARSMSPFTFRRKRRESSPQPQAIPLSQSDVDVSSDTASVRPRTAFQDDDSGDETETGPDDDSEDEWPDDEDDVFDPVTEANTERNAQIADLRVADGDLEQEPDPLGEGVNVVVPPEPYFPTTLNSYSSNLSTSASVRGKRNPRRRRSMKPIEPLPLDTSRPVFQRDRCTITLTQGDPDAKLAEVGRRARKYIVASDLSQESRYAVEWGIGTVLRDGDEMMIVTVVENESKVDPAIPNAADRANKLRSQQERQGLAYILARQATSLLQRTKLHVRVVCQAWHAKNMRHMLLDIVDYYEPSMLIVGSRGLGQIKGILLGSTSHYLIQKCSVPVMVARRRLKRPPRRQAHLAKHRAHVSLAEAAIDRVASRVDDDVQTMREEIDRETVEAERERQRQGGGIGASESNRRLEDEEATGSEEETEGEGEDAPNEDESGVKVAGGE
uniref:UspA domain-containing protein n=1 Tax=Schizophyllum commune (strain H4-8 / FGSC 9210) TaxID=578458 RepID=D8Q038_SCHCM